MLARDPSIAVVGQCGSAEEALVALAALKPDLHRIHRSAIVNLGQVRALEIREDGEYQVVLRSAQRLRMSRRYRKAVLVSLAAT